MGDNNRDEVDRQVRRDIDISERAEIACRNHGAYSPQAMSTRQKAWDSYYETYGFCSNTRPR